MDCNTRWALLRELQNHYKEFVDFLDDVMVNLLHYGRTTRIQRDIANTLQYDPANYLLVEAQRGEAKTTITSAYAIWYLIQNPSARVLVISAAGDMASQISSLMFRILFGMEVLECMRPCGDMMNASAKNFDVHHDLKGIDKSPSVVSKGADSNIQGFRADLVIGDDIESKKNSKTAVAREVLLGIIDEFTAICSNGKIVLLGTPQSANSVYNILPSRGCTVRIWTGRYPTAKQRPLYGDLLAPLIVKDIEEHPELQIGGGVNGDEGQVTDPVMFSEEKHQRKELQIGETNYQLQYMLNTSLLDANKQVLKIEDAMFMPIPPDKVYSEYMYGRGQGNQITVPQQSALVGKRIFRPMESLTNCILPYQSKRMDVDPAGGGANGDETGIAVTYYCNGYVYVPYCCGIKGGYDDIALDKILDTAVKYDVKVICVEKNFGNGMFTSLLIARARTRNIKLNIEEVYNTSCKELRMADVLEPLFSGHKIIFDEAMIDIDMESLVKYPLTTRKIYSLWHQINGLTRNKGCLAHDDRLDALAMACSYWAEFLSVDSKKAAQAKARAEHQKWLANPLGLDKSELIQTTRYRNSMMSRSRGYVGSKFTI